MNELDAVLSLLRQLEAFMRRHADKAWADALRQVQERGAQGREELKRAVLNMYKGTMGSLPDLIISRVNKHEVEDEKSANAELDRMVRELWVRAKAL